MDHRNQRTGALWALGLLAALAGGGARADQTALTQSGRTVVLQEDGRWRYADEEAPAPQASGLALNPRRFARAPQQSFEVKSTRTKAALWIEPAQWSFKRMDTDHEYRFQHKGGAVYASLITEVLQLPLEMMLEAGLENARQAAPDARVVERELREVNGQKVGMQLIRGTMKGLDVVYFSYAFSDASGSTQAVAWTTANAFAQHRPAMEKWLNGLSGQ